MTDVVIDGVRYTPARTGQPKIGVAVTTHNRPDILADTLAAIGKYSSNIPVVVVDDRSSPPAVAPDGVALVRHEKPQGIPAAKNRGITELMQLGVEHLFLFDDDTRPQAEDWWRPYVDGAEPHYAYCWTHFAAGQAVPKMDVLYKDSHLVGYGWSMGCLLYAHRTVIERVGGMHLGFGMGMEEHAEWSQRIHNAGFTSFVHQDHPGMKGKVWAADEHGAVARSFQPGDRARLLERNEKLRLARLDSTEFVEYRAPRDVVLTSFFTSQTDPQRNRKLAPDPKLLEPLRASVEHLAVLHDCFDSLPGEHHRVEAPLCAYTQRWLSQYQWLRDHPEIRWVWCVDATDVRQLNDPFPHMKPDTLYCGWEPTTVGCEWIRSHSPTQTAWIDEHAGEMLLNTGVVGGDRATVMRLCRRMTDLWAANPADPLHEMIWFNIAAREHPNLVTGPQVTTVFKAGKEADPISWFSHK